jgi:hypothetical protein
MNFNLGAVHGKHIAPAPEKIIILLNLPAPAALDAGQDRKDVRCSHIAPE